MGGTPTERMRGRTRAGLAIVSLLGFLVAFVGFAPSAAAHHPEISGDVECGDDSGWLVSFLSQSWQQTGGDDSGAANPDIAVLYRLRTGDGTPGAWVELPDKAEYRYAAANGYEFSDTFVLPEPAAGDRIQLRARADSNWGNGAGGGQTTDGDWIDLPGDCDEPGQPSASSSVVCVEGDGVATVTLSNTGGDLAVTFTVTDPVGGGTQEVTLAPGESQDVTFGGLGDGSVTIPIVAGQSDLTQTVDVLCDRAGEPSAAASIECVEGDGVATVTLSNTGGDLAVTFTVTDPVGGGTQEVTLAPGESQDVTFDGLGDGSVTIPIVAGGEDLSRTVDVDCDRPGVPEASSSVVCVEGDGVATVTLSNTGGDLAVTFTVTDPIGGGTQEVTLAPGESQDVTFGGLGDGSVTIPIVAGQSDLTQTVDVLCDRAGEPSAAASIECVEGDGVATVTLSNTGGDLAVTFTVTDPVGGGTQEVTLAPGGSQDVTFDGLGDGSVTIPIVAGGEDLSRTVDVDCDRPGVPEASTDLECQDFDGLVEIHVRNAGGDLPVTFQVTDPRTDEVTEITLMPGASDTVVLTGFTDGSWTIPVTAGSVDLTQVIEIDCDRPGTPQVTTEGACLAEGGEVTLVLSNAAEPGTAEPVVFSVGDPRGGDPEVVEVAAGESVSVSFSGFADGEHTFAVTADGTELAPVVVPVDCEQPSVTTSGIDCAEGGYRVEVTNTAGTPATIVVTKDGSVVETIEVDGIGEVLVPFVEGETATVVVSHDGDVLLDTEATYDCEVTAVNGTVLQCAEGGLEIEVGNSGESEALVAALIDDVEADQAMVPPGGTATLFVSLDEDETAHIVVTHDGDVLLDTEIEYDCLPPGEEPPPTPATPSDPPAQVLGVDLQQPLPVTGIELRWAVLGMALIALGSLMVSVTRVGRSART